MDYRVILSRPALRDLGEIARYIAQDSADAAERVGLELVVLADRWPSCRAAVARCAHGPACAG